MRLPLFFGFLIVSISGLAQDLKCQDLLAQHQIKPYFSLFFQAAGGQFITEEELSRSELGAQEWDSEFEEFTPFEDPRIDAIAQRMRAILQSNSFRVYSEHGRWNEFERRFLSPSSRFEVELESVVWAAFTLSALQGDISLASKWIEDHLPMAWLDANPRIAQAERMLINFGLSDRMRIYQAVYEVFSATMAMENRARLGQLETKLMDWSVLREKLSPIELFFAKQAFSWAPGQDFRRDQQPANLQTSIDLLMYELARGRVTDEIILQVESFLVTAVSDEDRLVHATSLSAWPAALEWLRGHKEDGTWLVRDVVEFRKFFPEIR